MTTTALGLAVQPIRTLVPRTRAAAQGRVQYIEVSSSDGPAALVARVSDGTGAVDCVFLGRRTIAGIEPGTVLKVEGMLGFDKGVLVIYNPRYELVPS